ncbi:MAG: M15 family metallopeptidase [Muribaculaceae bacterium]
MNPRLTITLALMVAFSALLHASQPNYDALMAKYGMVDVKQLEPTLIVDLRYASTNNFVGKNMYGTLQRAYLHRDAAKALQKAQQALQKINPGYSIIIYDAARPQSVQRTMWDVVKGTPNEQYVARPQKGGCHNFGVAVDVGLALNGTPLDMGTPFDTFSTASHITNEAQLVKQGIISKEALKNRQLLRQAMTQAGFKTYRREWWHFERYRVAYARANLRLLDF